VKNEFGRNTWGRKGVDVCHVSFSLQPRRSMFKFIEVEKRKMVQQSVKYLFR
jgi:hypothetical protein